MGMFVLLVAVLALYEDDVLTTALQAIKEAGEDEDEESEDDDDDEHDHDEDDAVVVVATPADSGSTTYASGIPKVISIPLVVANDGDAATAAAGDGFSRISGFGPRTEEAPQKRRRRRPPQQSQEPRADAAASSEKEEEEGVVMLVCRFLVPNGCTMLWSARQFCRPVDFV